MSVIIKSFAVSDENGEAGDMFYIKHASSNFTIIDCCMVEENQEVIMDEITEAASGKDITRFISTHPDEDHICGLRYLDEVIGLLNFYCVENKAKKNDPSESFTHYCTLRDDKKKHYYVYKGCKRKWMNDNDENDGKNYGSSGINFLWPDTSNEDFQKALSQAKEGKAYNNLSPIFTYSLKGNIEVMWMGDIEHDFLEKIKDQVNWPEVDVLFAPHHGRDSGKVSSDVLEKLKPQIIVIGEAPSKYLNYYSGYNTITQNSAGDIVFDCGGDKVHVYVAKDNYGYDTSFLSDENAENSAYGNYLGSFTPKGAK
ncbi:MAG: hypothetical protein SOX74_06815 [Candidatus Faecousia sp.]|uniref:hypothetical protein n=1 Tax=Faecousia sp. TaxID=2952921 RepID=UPI002A8C347C|nr:hypothetical protein [Candidatus Faecousia sp.]